MNTSAILLNRDYSFLCMVDWKRAMRLVFSEKVTVLRYSDREIQGVNTIFKVPAVILLIKFVRSVYRGHVPFSKKNVLVRDRHRCVYCGSSERPLTIDHVIPQSRGGKTGFDNCVACCRDCNRRKGARNPREAGMHLTRRAYQPTISEFVRIRLKQSDIYAFLVELGIYGE